MLAIGTILLFASISNAIQEPANQAPDVPGRRAVFPPKDSGDHPESDPEAGLPKLPAYHPVPEGPNQDPSQSDPHAQGSALEPNSCLSEEGCEQILDVAKELVESLADALQDFLQSSTSSSAPAFSTPAPATASTDGQPIPNLDVATAVSMDENYFSVLTPQEASMYKYDPLCFFANIERIYASAATLSTTAPTAAATTTAQSPTTYPTTCVSIVTGYCWTESPLPSSESSLLQGDLFGSWLPWQLISIYSPVAAGPGAALVTSTTTCVDVDNSVTFTTPYVMQLVSASGSPTSTPESTSTTNPSSAASTQRPAATLLVLMAIIAVMMGWGG